jgi:alkylation response protein AidB-like acyl-CoA dehydrogenase
LSAKGIAGHPPAGIGITEPHWQLASTVADFLLKRQALRQARALLDLPDEPRPAFWDEMAKLGWLGLHVPEEYGGSGYTLEELVVVVEQLGRNVTPGPFVPTVLASAVISSAGSDELKKRVLPGLVDGSVVGGAALAGSFEHHEGQISGSSDLLLGGGLAGLLVLPAGQDAVVVEAGLGVRISVPPNVDPTRRSARVVLDRAAGTVLPGARRLLTDIGRLILSAEAVGIARQCTDESARYAKERVQFGRAIGTFQAVKHHCANMLVATEFATSAVWDAARAAKTGGEQLSYSAATAGTLAGPAADFCANLNMQVHGGISITWEHEAHLYMRRATALLGLIDPRTAAADLVDLTRHAVSRSKAVELPPEAEDIRHEVRAFAESTAALDPTQRRQRLIDTGYVAPHWPIPYGRDAGPVEQLVIEDEFARAGINRPNYGITGWVILTLIQHGTDQQVARWVRPALDQEVIWCQLFSEPDAGSDAAGIKTRGTRVEGGWLVNGQKVWTSGAHVAGMGFATVRSDPAAPKHAGITMMAVDMHAPGVEVRPLRMISGASDFNEVFFNDVFVPDDDVVGPVDGGWKVARATLGNESVSIGSGQGQLSMAGSRLVSLFDAAPDRLSGGHGVLGRYIAEQEAVNLLNLRTAHRAVTGGEPGPEGAITKLALSELGHQASAILTELVGPDAAYTGAEYADRTQLLFLHRAMAIAGGTSEIKRNQIAERILGLPRDPLIN